MAEVGQDNGAGANSSKLLIIIIIVLLLIIAGGVAFFLLRDDGASSTDAEGPQVEQTSDDKEPPVVANEFVYYDVEQALRVNFPKGSSVSLIEVKVAFLLNHEDDIEALEKHQPMIINNLLMAISATGADQLQTREGKNKLRAAMLSETQKVMEKMTGKNTVREVFFTAFVMQ